MQPECESGLVAGVGHCFVACRYHIAESVVGIDIIPDLSGVDKQAFAGELIEEIVGVEMVVEAGAEGEGLALGEMRV